MATLMQFEVLSPDKYVFKADDVTYVEAITVWGGVGILPRHATMIGTLKDLMAQYLKFNPRIGKTIERQFEETKDIGVLTDFISINLPMDVDARQALLEAIDEKERFYELITILMNDLEIMNIRKGIQEQVKERVDKNQKEYLLREQLQYIREELGEDNALSDADRYEEALKKLHAPDGIFSVWGNHDYCEYNTNHSLSALRKNRRLLFQLQNEMGWHQLMNEHFTVSHGMASIEIIGVENAGQPPFTNRSNLKKAMKGVAKDAFKIVLTHDPHHWRREVQKTGVHLTLAGHTHAGQLKIGNFTPAHMAFKEWGGEYWQGRQLLYVSAGLGGSFPFRLGAWPEMTVITLKRDLG